MGLIAKLKKLFNKNIECGDEIKGHFIYLYPSSSRVVNVNSQIIVGDDYYAVFVCNDRVCDVLASGKHKITGATLPKSFSRLKLGKANRAGKYPKKFKADIYFVYKHIIPQQNFCSDNKFVIKSNDFGKVKGYSEGLCDIQITDPESLLKVLLIDRYYIKNKLGMQLTLGMVGDQVNKMIEQSKYEFTEIILNPSILTHYLNPSVNVGLDGLGIRLYNVEVTSFKLNRSLQKKVALFLAERKQCTEQFEKTGIKYQPEQIIPNKVDVSATVEQNPNSVLQQNGNENSVQNQSANSYPNYGSQPQIIRRGGGINMQNAPKEKTEYSAPLNASDVFNENDKKVCKFCGETIDAGFSFCPKCGFKQ